MGEVHSQFDKRLRNIDRKHKALARGYTTSLRPDGLIVAEPRRAPVQVPVKGVVLVIVAFFGFKGFLLAALGPATYEERVVELSNGTVVEQAGAWVMQPDRISQRISQQLGPIMR